MIAVALMTSEGSLERKIANVCNADNRFKIESTVLSVTLRSKLANRLLFNKLPACYPKS